MKYSSRCRDRNRSDLTRSADADGGGGVSKMDIDNADPEEEFETVRRAARKLLSSLPTDKTVYNEVLGAISSKDSGTALGKVLQHLGVPSRKSRMF